MAEFKSWKSYWNFQRSVRRDLRYVRSPETDMFLEAVLATSLERRANVKKGTVWWRAQLGHDWQIEGENPNTFEIEAPHPENRMKPLRDRASDGRANPREIPCLYLATKRDTAIAEVRPWIGSFVSVAQFQILKPLKVVDFSRDHGADQIIYLSGEPSAEEIEKAVWSEINTAFARPITVTDHSADYVPTQIIAELFKKNGLDGIAYRSNFGKNGYNVALFDLDSADLINCGLYRVDKIEMTSSEQANPYFVTKSSRTKSLSTKRKKNGRRQ